MENCTNLPGMFQAVCRISAERCSASRRRRSLVTLREMGKASNMESASATASTEAMPQTPKRATMG